mgnify:CR=1 FL=1
MEDNQDNQDYSNLQLDYAKVLASKDTLSVTRMLAAQLINGGYLSVGEFLKSLSDTDLQMLVNLTDEKDTPHVADFIVMAEMLAIGEGCDSAVDSNEFQYRTQQMITFILLESLYRKGLVELTHENLSFHPDMVEAGIVRLKQD